MPELPEVECLSRAIADLATGKRLVAVRFLRKDLREPIPVREFKQLLEGQEVIGVRRRSKYLLIETGKGYGIFHLGMTGNMFSRPSATPEQAHTHAVFTLEGGGLPLYLHFVDPRRFGRIACQAGRDFSQHPLFKDLGPEPLEMSSAVLGAHLKEQALGKRQPVKCFIMDSHRIVGVGNIYASEALFKAGIHPQRPAHSITKKEFIDLAAAIQTTLRAAIRAGGTSFRDYRHADGTSGYFKVELAVYDRAGEPCPKCANPLGSLRQAGRSTYFCPNCQK